MEKARALYAARTTPAGEVTGKYTVAEAVEAYLRHLEDEGKSSAPRRAHARERPDPPGPRSPRRFQVDGGEDSEVAVDLAKAPPRLRSADGQGPRFGEFDSEDEDAVRRRRATANRMLNTLRAA